jgi:DNA-binding transcriptional LysR family regulator
MRELRLLRYFVAVAEAEHVGRAAERLHISQSPLSRQIRQLEDQLGLVLFDRERRRFRITEIGRWFLEEARGLLSQADRLARDANRYGRGEIGRVSIGFVQTAMWSSVLPAALRRFQVMRPGISIELHNMSSTSQIDAMRRQELDLGFVNLPPTDRIFTSVAVLDEPYLLAIPEGHRLAKKSRIIPADLDGEPWVTFSRKLNPGVHDRMMAASAKAGFTPDVRYEATDSSTILGLVEAGLGLALLQGSVRGSGPASVIFRALSWFPLSVRVHLVRRRIGLTPAAEQLVDIVVADIDSHAVRCSPGGNRAARKKVIIEPP